MRRFNTFAKMKQQLYEDKLASDSGMDYGPGIMFETSMINQKNKIGDMLSLGMTTEKVNKKDNKNNLKTCWCGSFEHSRVTSKGCPVGKARKSAKDASIAAGHSKEEAKKAGDAAAKVCK